MRQSDLQRVRQYANDTAGLYGMQDFTYNEGRARGMRAISLKNGRGLEATLLADRCLDVPYFSYKGVNLGLVSKTGLCAPAFFNEQGAEGFLRQFNAGLLTTCGLANAGGPNTAGGRTHGLHGRIANTPCTDVNKEEITQGDAISLQVSGEAREAQTFGDYLVLRRQVRMETEADVLHVTDTVENRGFAPAPLVNLYHINFGYPLLDAGARVYFSLPDVAPNDEMARKNLDRYSFIEPPTAGRPEECFVHTGGSGEQFGMIYNEPLGLAVAVYCNVDDLPFYCQWKSMASGDYALGLEPSAAGFWGLERALEKGCVKYLEAGQSKTYRLRIEVLSDTAAIGALAARCKEN